MRAGIAATTATLRQCLLVAMFAEVCAAGQVTSGVEGEVVDPSGASIPRATVSLVGPVTKQTPTDESGGFVLQMLPPGDYTVVAEAAGFNRSVQQLRLAAGQIASIQMVLKVRMVETVTVTAEPAGARGVHDGPMAISSIPEQQLRSLEAHTVADLAGAAPSVTFAQNTGLAQLTIRGIGTNAVFAGADPSSAVYLDGVYLARPASVLAEFLDLQRVEVVRGPQGTLYGRNVVGGAINLITKVPDSEPRASARVVFGSLRTMRAEASGSGPLVGTRVMASGALLRGVADGYVQDLEHPDDPLGGIDVTAARGTVRAILASNSELRIMADFSHRDPRPLFHTKVLTIKPGFAVSNPGDPRQVRTSTQAVGRHVQYGAAVQLSWRPTSTMSIASLFAWRRLDYRFTVDGDITEHDLIATTIHERHHQVSQEVSVNHQGEKLAWTAGIFFFRDVDRQPTMTRLLAADTVNILSPIVQGSSSATYGQLRVPLMRRITGTAGLRYSRERKTFHNSGGTQVWDVSVPTFDYDDLTRSTAWTPKIGLEAGLSNRTLLYISATRGFKVGGFNLTATSAGQAFAPEWAWSYEAGFKWTADRAALSAALYYTDYQDVQVQTPIRPGVVSISNAAAATLRGVEIEGDAHVTNALRAGGHVAMLRARYDRYNAVDFDGSVFDATGRRLSNAPDWSGRVWAEYRVPMGGARSLSLYADAVVQSAVYFTPRNDGIQWQPSYSLINANVTFSLHRHWAIGVYARNLLDADYINGTTGAPPPAIGGRPGEPRHIGVQFTVTS